MGEIIHTPRGRSTIVTSELALSGPTVGELEGVGPSKRLFDIPRMKHVITDTHWSQRDRLGRSEFRALVAEVDGKAVGLVHFLFHRHCWRVENVCYLQDLYADPEVRGSGRWAGVGRSGLRGRGRGVVSARLLDDAGFQHDGATPLRSRGCGGALHQVHALKDLRSRQLGQPRTERAMTTRCTSLVPS